MKNIFTILILCLGISATAEELFKTMTSEQLPLREKKIQTSTEGKITVKQFFISSMKENGAEHRIYCIYGTPVRPGKYPVIIHIHGGGQQADPSLVKRWASRGYACLSFDWTGNPGKKRKRGDSFSTFGTMTTEKHSKSLFPENFKKSRVRYIQIALRRILQWLDSQSNADTEKLGILGISWGGFSSLLAAETINRISAVVDIYGAGFFTGTYALTGPLGFCTPHTRKAWLNHYDPGARIKKISVPVMILSGTNDMFFPLKQLLKTYEETPSAKRLVLYPNINHGLSWNMIDVQATSWFDTYLKNKPHHNLKIAAFTKSDKEIKGRIKLDGTKLKAVHLVYSWSAKELSVNTKTEWKSNSLELYKNNFMGSFPAIAPNHQNCFLNYYINVISTSGTITSTPVSSIKISKYAATPKQVANPGNFFADPSLEKQKSKGYNGKTYFNHTGKYVWDDSGKHARLGKAAAHLSGNNQLIMQANGIEAGKTYLLAGWLKCAGTSNGANIRINWLNSGKFIKTSLYIGKAGMDDWKQLKLQAKAPAGANTAILYYNASDAWIDDLSFSDVPQANSI